MKIDLVLRGFPVGGVERQMLVLMRGLSKRHEVTLYSLLPIGSEHPWLKEEPFEIRIVLPHLRPDSGLGPWALFQARVKLQSLMSARRPDVLYAVREVAIGVGGWVARRLDIPWVAGYRVADHVFSFRIRMLIPWVREISRSAGLNIANSESAMRFYQDWGFGNRKWVVVDNGIEDWSYPRSRRDNEVKVIGGAGRLAKMKDFETLICAFGLLMKELKEAAVLRLAVHGSSLEKEKLYAFARQEGLIDNLELVEMSGEMVKFYDQLDLFVLSSQWGESFPNVLAEAMLAGVPCVSTDVGAARKILNKDDRIVPVKDPEKLAWAMLNALKNETEAEQEKRQDHIQKHFSVTTLVERTEALLLKVIADDA